MANTSKDKIDIRTKMAIRILLLIVRLLDPWEYSHQYTKDFEQLDKLLKEAD